jgi:hypothetical protein
MKAFRNWLLASLVVLGIAAVICGILDAILAFVYFNVTAGSASACHLPPDEVVVPPSQLPQCHTSWLTGELVWADAITGGLAVLVVLVLLAVPVIGGIAFITPDARQARRRNAGEHRRAEEDRARFVTEYLGRGYGQEAADALAAKRIRDENRQPRVWMAADIAQERLARMHQAEKARQDAEMQRREERLQQRIAAGELAQCPNCERYAPASQGVILSHRLRSGQSCAGEGTVVPLP